MKNIYEVLNLAATEKAPTRVKLTREKLAQREYQERIAQAVREHSVEFYDARLGKGGITDQAFENVFGNRVSQLTILLMATCYTRAQIVDIMGIKEGSICNYLTQCTDREVFYVQEPKNAQGFDGVLRISTEAEWEKHRIAGVSKDPVEQAKKKQAELVRHERKLVDVKERLAAVVNRLTVAPEDEELLLQHKSLNGQKDMLEVAIVHCHQALEAFPPVEEIAPATDADEGTDVDEADLFE